jgi:hygromycin-B 4-O-kinase
MVERSIRMAPRSVRRRGGGLTNFVYQVDLPDLHLIVRINPNPERLAFFQRERRAMALARDGGLPVPLVLTVGAEPHPFMVLEQVRGLVGTRVPNRLNTVKQMGELTARIHQIALRGFGPSALDPGHGAARHSWGAYLEIDLRASERLDALEALLVLPKENAATLRRTLAHMSGWRRNPVLHHGDMRLKNVIVDRTGSITGVLDWENCTSSVPALWDLSIAMHDLSIDEKQSFLQGYGMTPRELTKAVPYLRLLNAINYAPKIEHAAQHDEKSKVNWYRARIAGDLNLY